MKHLATLLLLLATATPALAQAQHPCDANPGTVFRFPSSQLSNLRVGFCFDGKDVDGNLLVEQVGFKMDIENGAQVDLGYLQPVLPPNTAGYSYYEFHTDKLAAGSIHMHAYTTLLGDSAPSTGVILTLQGPPKPPKGTAIIK